jgi:hypothetical protein
MMRCRAKAKQRQEQCRLLAVPGMDVCRFHGGLTPRGPASATFKNGKYSKFLPSRMVARYREAERDPELTSLRSELALVDARLMDLLTRVHSGESGVVWVALRKAHRTFKVAQRSGDVAQMRAALDEIGVHIEAAVVDHEAWREIHDLVEARRKLADTESRRLATLKQMLTQEQALLLVGRVVDIVTRHVPDRQVLANVVLDLQRLMEREETVYGLEEGTS